MENNKKILRNGLSAQILHNIPEHIDRKVYELEYNTFSKRYVKCPSTYHEYRIRQSSRNIVATLLFHNSDLAGVRMFELINPNHCHSMMMAISPPYREQGLADLICALSVNYLRWLGIRYISSWTHIHLQVVNILERYAPLLSRSEKLSEVELSCRIAYEESRKPREKHYGQKRTIEKFYKMVDGSIGDAYFWVHQIT